MYYKCTLLILTFLTTFNSSIFCQGLEDQLNFISSNNDMMGASVVVFCEDGIIESLAIGKSDHSRNIDMTEDSKYRIASISKTITAIAIMQLVEKGLVELDDDISTILGYSVYNPNFPSEAITVRMLLSHKSSIIDGSTYSSFLGATVNNNPIPDLSEILTPGGAYYNSSQFNNIQPGTYFNYSNINYVILGTIVEKLSNLRFDEYCKQNISEPLGIDASFNVNDLEDINQLSVLYRKPNGIWTPQNDNYQGIQPDFANIINYEPGTNGGRFGPQGGFRCSAKDLASIFITLMNKGSYNNVTLLSEDSCNQMFNNEWTYNGSNGNNYYGLFNSWGLGIHRITSTPGNDIALAGSQSMLGHAGEAYGLVSDAYFDTERKVGFVFMNNGVGIGYQTNNYSIFYTVEQEVFTAIESYADLASCNQATATNEPATAYYKLYPNPVTEYLTIPECQNINQCEIDILNINGQKLKTLQRRNVPTQIDVRHLEAGMYYIKINGKQYPFIKH